MSEDWQKIWEDKKGSRFEMTGFSDWISQDEYLAKLSEIAEYIKSHLQEENKVINVGAGPGFLEEYFKDRIENGNWYAIDQNKNAIAESNGLVKYKHISNLKSLSKDYDTLLMVSSSQYFREGYIYAAIKCFQKVFLIDVAIKENNLSVSSMRSSHSMISLSNLQVLNPDVIEIKNLSISDFRYSLYISND